MIRGLQKIGWLEWSANLDRDNGAMYAWLAIVVSHKELVQGIFLESFWKHGMMMTICESNPKVFLA
jgi:hypothetical protein